jgi:23S rRNA (cytosine1962-C5)-methyltransferase
LESADNNAKLNGFEIDFVHSDVFDFLNEAVLNGLKWDVVILDPPAFTKNKKSVGIASAAYSKLNKLGFQVLNDGGYLVTSSCSQHITEEDFVGFIKKEASKQEKFIKLVYRGTQPADHPVLLSMPETSYLKYFIFKAENLQS